MIKYPYRTRIVMQLHNAEEAHQADKMGNLYLPPCRDAAMVLDLDRVMAYQESEVCNGQEYTGHPAVIVTLDDGSEYLLLERFAKFDAAIQVVENESAGVRAIVT